MDMSELRNLVEPEASSTLTCSSYMNNIVTLYCLLQFELGFHHTHRI